MAVLWLNLATVFSLSFGARYFSHVKENTMDHPVPIRPNQYLVFLSFAVLTLVSGLRQNIGDTYFYRHLFNTTEFTWEKVLEGNEAGFAFLQLVIQSFNGDAQAMIFIVAAITLFLIVYTLAKYSRVFELSLFIFIASGMFLVSMNGLRQYLAAAIIFSALPYILKGKFIYFAGVVLLASTIHESAIVLIPVYFIVRREAWSRNTIILLFVGIIGVYGYDFFSELFFKAIEETSYGGYASFQEGGANVIRVAVTAAPLVLAYIGREKLRELFPKSDYIVNLCLLGVLFMLLATQNWIFARFAIYFDLFNLILISWIIKIFQKKDQLFIYYSILILYLIYFIYEYIITLNIEYRSEFINLF